MKSKLRMMNLKFQEMEMIMERTADLKLKCNLEGTLVAVLIYPELPLKKCIYRFIIFV